MGQPSFPPFQLDSLEKDSYHPLTPQTCHLRCLEEGDGVAVTAVDQTDPPAGRETGVACHPLLLPHPPLPPPPARGEAAPHQLDMTAWSTRRLQGAHNGDSAGVENTPGSQYYDLSKLHKLYVFFCLLINSFFVNVVFVPRNRISSHAKGIPYLGQRKLCLPLAPILTSHPGGKLGSPDTNSPWPRDLLAPAPTRIISTSSELRWVR